MCLMIDSHLQVTNASCSSTGDHNSQCAADLYYSANIFTQRATKLIAEVGTDLAAKPLFMYLAYGKLDP